MSRERETEIRSNFSYFQGIVATLMASHAGEYALLHECSIIDYFRTAADAIGAGAKKFGDKPFSVQHVINRPIDLGFLSHAADNGIAV